MTTRDPETNPAAFLGGELRRARIAAGFSSQDSLAARLGFDRTVITGQALLLGRPVLLAYGAAVAAAFAAFVLGYEQPALARRYGAQYEAYRRAVPGWWPRLRPAHRELPRSAVGGEPDGS